MADEQELSAEGKGSKKMMIIIIIAVVVLLGGGVAAWLLLSGDDTPVEDASATTEVELMNSVGGALYVGMPRPFVFNVADDLRDRLVQIKVQLLVRGEQNDVLAKKHIPLIEGALLHVFSSATVDELSSQKGKELVRDRALDSARKALKSITGIPVIEQVLFTGFVMQ